MVYGNDWPGGPAFRFCSVVFCHRRLNVCLTHRSPHSRSSSLPAPFLPHFPVIQNLTPLAATQPHVLQPLGGAGTQSTVCWVLSEHPASAAGLVEHVISVSDALWSADCFSPPRSVSILAVSCGHMCLQSLSSFQFFLLACPGCCYQNRLSHKLCSSIYTAAQEYSTLSINYKLSFIYLFLKFWYH